VPLSTQVYKWLPANLVLGVTGNPAMDWHPIQGEGEKGGRGRGVEILLVASCHRNQR